MSELLQHMGLRTSLVSGSSICADLATIQELVQQPRTPIAYSTQLANKTRGRANLQRAALMKAD